MCIDFNNDAARNYDCVGALCLINKLYADDR